MGPVLNDVVGRQAASYPGFSYSTAMKKARDEQGLLWTPDKIHAFIESPRTFLPGTKMAFAGVKDAAKIDDIIAYLATFSPGYEPAEGAPGAAGASSE
jgi:cytochrome c